MNFFAMLILLSSFWISSSEEMIMEGYPTTYKTVSEHDWKLTNRCVSIWESSIYTEFSYIKHCRLTPHLFIQTDRKPLLQAVAKQPRECLFIYKFYGKMYIMETCLITFRNMSIVAGALSIQNDTSLLHVNTTELVSFLRNIEEPGQSDWIIAALCLILMPDEVFENEIGTVVHVLGSMMTFTHADIYFRFTFYEVYQNLQRAINNIKNNITVLTPNLAIIKWYPFQNDFNGVAWYKNNSSTGGDFIKKISHNCKIHSISRKNLKMAVCIPHNFLRNLIAKSKFKQTQDMFVVLEMTKENYFLKNAFFIDVYDVVRIKIPGYCKRNEFPVIKVMYEDNRRVYEHGHEYFDSGEYCSLSESPGFARIRNSSGFFESVKTRYCMRYPIGQTFIRQTQSGTQSYPENYCVNRNAEIPHLRCDYNERWINKDAIDLECENDYITSADSYTIYKFATQCWNIKSFGDVLLAMNSTNLTAIDRKMFFDILECISESRTTLILREDIFFDAINLALELSRKLPKQFIKPTKMSKFLVIVLPKFISNQIRFKADDNYIYQRLQLISSPLIGIVVYKRGGDSLKHYDVKPLTNDNITTDYTLDMSVEAIVYITNIKTVYREGALSILITRTSLYPENDTVAIKSRSLVIYSNLILELKVYLRIIENEGNWRFSHYTGEGYSFNATVKKYRAAILSIAENNTHNYCESSKSVKIRNYMYYTPSSTRIVMDKATKNKIDLLSMISMSVNNAEGKTGMEEVYNKYSSFLKFFRMLGSVLSLLGVAILFTTAIVLKNWRKTRFYTIQLAIILASQVIFFIIETQIREIPQSAFFVLYYSILSQFCWMSLIGYVQYTRYIKILGSRKLGIVKSLIIGWLLPALIITISLLSYADCFKCNLCYKNKDIFLFFVLIPVGLVVVVNLIIYVLAMINIWSNQEGVSLASERKLKIRASISLPFLLGITWIFAFALISPWTWLFVVGLFLVHIIIPSQALVLCIFAVLLHNPTRQQWKARIMGILKKQE